MDAVTALQMIARLLAILALVQGFEFIALRQVTSDQGVWRWADLEGELSGLRFFLSGDHFLYLNVLRMGIALGVLFLPNPWGVCALLMIHLLTMFRWRGAFNGGSDAMNLLLLLFVSIGLIWPQSMAQVSLWYITVQTCLSYFKAGWFKLKNSGWRDGSALREFVNSPIYEPNPLLTQLTQYTSFNRLGAWTVLVFEITFPLCLLHPKLAFVYMTMGFFFHLANAYVFGLNRFFFAWVAAYPALVYCSWR